MSNVTAVSSHLEKIISQEDLSDKTKIELKQLQEELISPLQTDRWIYRTVVIILGLVVIMTVIGGLYLEVIGNGDDKIGLPQAIVSIGSAAIGALAGLLAPSPSG